jgi:hypothetical protein
MSFDRVSDSEQVRLDNGAIPSPDAHYRVDFPFRLIVLSRIFCWIVMSPSTTSFSGHRRFRWLA